MTKAQFKIM